MDNFQYNQYAMAQQAAIDNSKKTEELKERIAKFSEITTLNEAKELAQTVMPTKQEVTSFYSGNAKCTIVNKDNMLRVCFDSPEEFICYDFS